MHELIEVIEAALADDGSAEAKQAGAQACRKILAALEPESSKPPAAAPVPVPAAAPPNPLAALAGLDLDRTLDLVIARLRAAVPEEKRPAKSPTPGVRIQLVPVPKSR